MSRILVIDDEEEIRSVVKHHLLQANYEVLEAEDGKMAIQKINEGDNSLTVDAAICDIRMPQIDGTEAINYLQKEYPTLPLIVMTGFADTQLAVGFLKTGVKDYLIKPVGKDTLLAAVNKAVLERQRH
jgi:two-component system chemotaxis response regulator CheY